MSGLLDVAKASVAVLIVIAIGGDSVAQVGAALAAIVGHSRSPYIGLHGGRGVAPATGGVLIIQPLVLVAMFPVFILIILITRISSLGSLSASLMGGVTMIVITAVTPLAPIYYVYGICGAGLIWLFHMDNIGRLFRGEERRIGGRHGKTEDGAGGTAAGA